MRLSLPRGPKFKTEVPTSSMADIAFLLIVFFMLTSVFSSTKGMNLILGEQPDPGDQILPAIYVHNLGDGVVEVANKPVALNKLNQRLAGILRQNHDKPVMLHSNPEIDYAEFTEVYDQLMVLQASLSEEFTQDGSEQEWSLNLSIPTLKELEIIKQLHPELF